MARATAPRKRQSPMRKSMNCVTTLIAHSAQPIVFTAKRKTIRCLPYRVDHWNRKMSRDKSHQCTATSRHQRSPPRQFSVTQCQRRRPKSTKTSIQLNHRLIHGTRMDRHRKVSCVWCFDSASQCFHPIAGNFYSSSDSESEEEMERKIRVEIKPLNNGTAPISASVDELRATVENLSLSPIGALSVNVAWIIRRIEAFFLLWVFISGWKSLELFSSRFNLNQSHLDVWFLIHCIFMPCFSFFHVFHHLSASIKSRKILFYVTNFALPCCAVRVCWKQKRIWLRSRIVEVRRTKTSTWNDLSRCRNKWLTRPVT